MNARLQNKLYAVSLFSFVLALGACGDYSDADYTTDSGTTSDAGPDASAADASHDAATSDSGGQDASSSSDAATADASIPVFNDCSASDYVDQSGTSTVEITFGGSLGLKYSPACVTIQVGQTVEFSGDFATHPLIKGTASDSNAGSANSPITGTTSSGSTKTFTFTAAGTYPYVCNVHKNAGMVGSIHVQ